MTLRARICDLIFDKAEKFLGYIVFRNFDVMRRVLILAIRIAYLKRLSA